VYDREKIFRKGADVPEERDGNANGGKEGDLQTNLGTGLGMSLKVRVEAASDVPDVDRDGDHAGNDESEVRESRKSKVEVVLFRENDREGFEPEVEDSWKDQSEN
jgi:hypothetical protein